ncbi:Zinc finger protein ZPR1-like protein [Drosera capensis]
MMFPSTCGACVARCETRMFVTKIPYFQDVIVVASTCDSCGYRNSQLKPGGRISEKGKRVTVRVENIKDLSHDVIKRINNDLERVHGFTFGDSLDEAKKRKWLEFRSRLNKLLALEESWSLIIDDPLANSFVAPVTDDIMDDKQLTSEEYERTWEQKEELGLNDMDTSSADAAYN